MKIDAIWALIFLIIQTEEKRDCTFLPHPGESKKNTAPRRQKDA